MVESPSAELRTAQVEAREECAYTHSDLIAPPCPKPRRDGYRRRLCRSIEYCIRDQPKLVNQIGKDLPSLMLALRHRPVRRCRDSVALSTACVCRIVTPRSPSGTRLGRHRSEHDRLRPSSTRRRRPRVLRRDCRPQRHAARATIMSVNGLRRDHRGWSGAAGARWWRRWLRQSR